MGVGAGTVGNPRFLKSLLILLDKLRKPTEWNIFSCYSSNIVVY